MDFDGFGAQARDPRLGRGVIITGAGGGVGRAAAMNLASAGFRLVLLDVDADRLHETAGEEGVAEAVVRQAVLDAADFGGVSDVVASAAAHGLEFVGLVAAAGIFVIEDFLNTRPEDWRRSIEVNLIGTMSVTHAVVPHIRDAGGGSIVTITSTAGESGSARPAAAYAASKAGVIGFTKSIARELAPAGIRANAISPGPLDTRMLQIGSKQQREEIEARTLVGRLGRPEDIAEAAAFLISEESSFITGEVLRVNGGSLL